MKFFTESIRLKFAKKLALRFRDFLYRVFTSLFEALVFACPAILGWCLFTNSHTWYAFVLGVFLMFVILPSLKSASRVLVELIKVFEIPTVVAQEWAIEVKQASKRKEAEKNLDILLLVSRDCLPDSAYVKFNIKKSGQSPKGMYDTCFALLVWVWVEHCREAKEDTNIFVATAQKRYPTIYRIFQSIDQHVIAIYNANHRRPQGESTHSPFVDVVWVGERLSLALDWISTRLTVDLEDKENAQLLFSELVCNFCKANDFWTSWINDFRPAITLVPKEPHKGRPICLTPLLRRIH